MGHKQIATTKRYVHAKTQAKQQEDAKRCKANDDRRARKQAEDDELQDRLYRQIGQLQVELDWLKKKSASMSVEAKRTAVEPGHLKLTLARQCELLGLCRASWYYRPAPVVSLEDERLMRAIDEQYTATPFYGSRPMAVALRERGHAVGRRRVRRLVRLNSPATSRLTASSTAPCARRGTCKRRAANQRIRKSTGIATGVGQVERRVVGCEL